ncbi:MAPEG family protein [Vibrio nigripulchritudo ATCC 27043]|uniref:MAPEG family protein n=1 Tax=Vibrio nigripulchritudo TaxID=28173 RepID=UPI00021C3BE7|nr:MAPEG family protein [Vibrio nigripulchritudo]EGU52433.1 MAPEG family protein [Vibrio nigripulchritudo ATCC 27043]CCN33779.1 putative Mapeg family protein [Vibrio nigripulchritudo AM115]CCN41981.1 putative Mapeg family protein [Vibrio nigripulchritudo FTn2]CCN66227.1 putative Mapeg family protein [Vibrio nigripulchritudo POn4]CCN69552.1 putative Mapeg family protein [Vibrio nigripulchritudo SFn118]
MSELDEKQKKYMKFVLIYPFVVLIIGVAVNLLITNIPPLVPSIPSTPVLSSLAISGVLLAINHAWLMTATETTRVRYKLYATPEEWEASDYSKQDATQVAWQELERAHNAHRNATENTVCFLAVALPFLFVSPPSIIAYVWVVGFALARLGYTYGYLSGNDNFRSIFMTLSLLASFGIGSYLFIALIQ